MNLTARFWISHSQYQVIESLRIHDFTLYENYNRVMKRQLIINLLAGQTLLFALSHCCVDSLNSAANESMGNPPENKVNICLEIKININNIFKIQTCIMGCNKSKLNSSSCDFISDCLLNCSRFACLSQIYWK